MVCHVCTCIKKGPFNHCGRSKAWNSIHHGRYVFQTAFFFFVRNMNTDMCIYTYTYIYKYMFLYMCVYICMCVYVCVLMFFCCVVPCHFACRALLVVGWLGGWVVGCVVVDMSLSWWSLSLVLPASYDDFFATGKSGAFND